jgi:hypothetical protein
MGSGATWGLLTAVGVASFVEFVEALLVLLAGWLLLSRVLVCALPRVAGPRPHAQWRSPAPSPPAS